MNTTYAAYYLETSCYHVEKSTASSSTYLMCEEAETSVEAEITMTFEYQIDIMPTLLDVNELILPPTD